MGEVLYVVVSVVIIVAPVLAVAVGLKLLLDRGRGGVRVPREHPGVQAHQTQTHGHAGGQRAF